MTEIILALLFCLTLLTVMAAFGGIAIALNARFLVPFIFAAVWWLCAGVNFHDARVAVESTGYVKSKGERVASLARGIGQIMITIPLFVPQMLPHHFYSFVAFCSAAFLACVVVVPYCLQKIVDASNNKPA